MPKDSLEPITEGLDSGDSPSDVVYLPPEQSGAICLENTSGNDADSCELEHVLKTSNDTLIGFPMDGFDPVEGSATGTNNRISYGIHPRVERVRLTVSAGTWDAYLSRGIAPGT